MVMAEPPPRGTFRSCPSTVKTIQSPSGEIAGALPPPGCAVPVSGVAS